MALPVVRILRVLLAAFFIAGGIYHFWNPQPYLSMMPPWLPWPTTMNLIAGAAEIAGGAGVLIPALRRAAAWGLIALLVAVFPANLQVALHGWPGMHLATWVLWARLPFQIVFIAWVWIACLKSPHRDGIGNVAHDSSRR